MNTTTICQRTITLKLGDREVTVRRMYWKAARAFIKKLATHLTGIASSGTDLSAILPKLPELITSADDLTADLVSGSTDFTAEQIDQLDVAQFAAILDAAIELNLGEDLKNSFAGIAAKLEALIPATKTSPGA